MSESLRVRHEADSGSGTPWTVAVDWSEGWFNLMSPANTTSAHNRVKLLASENDLPSRKSDPWISKSTSIARAGQERTWHFFCLWNERTEVPETDRASLRCRRKRRPREASTGTERDRSGVEPVPERRYT